jgi:IS5 family transposase
LRFRPLLEEHRLAEQFLHVVNARLAKAGLILQEGTMVDAPVIAAPASTKHQVGERNP